MSNNINMSQAMSQAKAMGQGKAIHHSKTMDQGQGLHQSQGLHQGQGLYQGQGLHPSQNLLSSITMAISMGLSMAAMLFLLGGYSVPSLAQEMAEPSGTAGLTSDAVTLAPDAVGFTAATAGLVADTAGLKPEAAGLKPESSELAANAAELAAAPATPASASKASMAGGADMPGRSATPSGSSLPGESGLVSGSGIAGTSDQLERYSIPGTSGAPSTKARRGQNSFTIAVSTEPLGLDPAIVNDNYSGDVLFNIYESLLRFKHNSMEVEPALAERYTISPDGLSYTFYLRQGVVFHDGTPFNAEAVAFNIKRQLPPLRTESMTYADLVYGAVDKVDVIDDYTITITLKERTTPFLRNLAMLFAAPIASPSAIEKYHNNLMLHPVGTGPYQFERWVRGDHLVLQRFASYWGQKAKIDKLVFRFMKESGSRVVALNNGEVDAITGLDAHVIKQIKQGGNKLYQAPGTNTFYMIFNTRPEAVTHDVRVRKALAQAIDVPTMVKALYQGYSTYAPTYFPEFLPGYSKDTPVSTYNPKQAQATLQELGVNKVKIIANANATYSNAVGGQVLSEAIQSYLKQVGVSATIELYDFATYKAHLITDSWDLSFIGCNGDNGDPDNFINFLALPDPTVNQGLWQHQEFIDLVNKGTHLPEGDERTKLYERTAEIIATEMPLLPIAHAQNLVAYRPLFQGLRINPFGFNILSQAQRLPPNAPPSSEQNSASSSELSSEPNSLPNSGQNPEPSSVPSPIPSSGLK